MPTAPSSPNVSVAFPGSGLPANYIFIDEVAGVAANPPKLYYVDTQGLSMTEAQWGAKVNDVDILKTNVGGEYVIELATYVGPPKK